MHRHKIEKSETGPYCGPVADNENRAAHGKIEVSIKDGHWNGCRVATTPGQEWPGEHMVEVEADEDAQEAIARFADAAASEAVDTDYIVVRPADWDLDDEVRSVDAAGE